MEKEKSNW